MPNPLEMSNPVEMSNPFRQPAMFKSISIIQRALQFTPEQHLAYWNDRHAPLFVRSVPPTQPGLVRYVQYRVLRSARFESAADGVAETAWDSVESYRAYLDWRRTPAAMPLIEDEGRLNASRQRIFATSSFRFERAPQPSVPGERVKAFAPVRRRAGLSESAFASRWQGDYGPAAAQALAQRFPGLQGYVLYSPVAVEGVEPSLDGVVELTWSYPDAFCAYAAWRSGGPAQDVIAQVADLIDMAAHEYVLSTERVIFQRPQAA